MGPSSDPRKLDVMRTNCIEAAKTLNWEHEQRGYFCVLGKLLPNTLVP